MKNIYILILILVSFGSGIALAHNHYDSTATDFRDYGQYDPEYMLYTDDEMLYKCEDHGLVYDRENGICI